MFICRWNIGRIHWNNWLVKQRLKKHAKGRKGRLEDAKALFQLWEDHEEEEAWLVEKKRICQTGISAKDLRAVLSLQQKHKVRHSPPSHLHNMELYSHLWSSALPSFRFATSPCFIDIWIFKFRLVFISLTRLILCRFQQSGIINLIISKVSLSDIDFAAFFYVPNLII